MTQNSFYVNLQEGKYWIDEIYIRKYGDDGSWTSLYTHPVLKSVVVEGGKVNNSGTIQWSVIDRKHNIVQTDNSSDIKIKFSQKFPESAWNQIEWKYNQLSFEVTMPTNAPRK